MRSKLMLSFADEWRRRQVLVRRAAWSVPLLAMLLVVFVTVVLSGRRDNGQQPVPRADYVWVQVLPDGDGVGGRLARAIVTYGNRCPQVVENGQALEMHEHRSRVRAAFPILLCERELAADSKASIGPDELPIRPTEPLAIAVIGDTGCRLTHFAHQPCGVTWPFQQIARKIAAMLTQDKGRSLIIHVGDFHYREKPCLDDDRGCGRSPYGDNWDAWKAEFFDPAKKLMLSAPWVILRGNHENCARAGAGWLFFFALPHQAFDGVCEDDRPSYHLNIGYTPEQHPRMLLVLDTANEADNHPRSREKHLNDYSRWVADFADPGAEVWLALHQPLWLLGHEEDTLPENDATTANCAGDNTPGALDAIRNNLRKTPRYLGHQRFSLILSGDTHMFQLFRPEEADLPVQIVAGNGGTALDDLPCKADTPFRVDRSDVTSHDVKGAATAIARFGFVMLRPNGDHWTATLLDSAGKPLTSCTISGPSPANPCTPTPEAQAELSPEPLPEHGNDLAPSIQPSGIVEQSTGWSMKAAFGFDMNNVAGFLGVLLILVAYGANQLGEHSKDRQDLLQKWLTKRIKGWRYLALNLLGAVLILLSILPAWNTPAFFIGLAWVLISIDGIIWIVWKRAPPQGAI